MKTVFCIAMGKTVRAQVLRWVVPVLILLPLQGRAQQAAYFTANGRNVDVKAINSQVEQMIAATGVPALSVAVIENNRIAFYNAYGVRSRGKADRVDKGTVFEGCSLSKSFLVHVAYQLVDEGKLDLDKPLYQYLEYEKLAYDSRYRAITGRMVLSHSSGLENWEWMNKADTLEILSDPGQAYVYSGEGYQYLAKVIEKILQKPYEAYVQERVIRPLGLKHTYLNYDEKGEPLNNTVGHLAINGQRTFRNTFPIPAAGNHFTAEDYARLIIGTFDGSRLSAARVRDMTTPISKIATRLVNYGPGFEVFRTKDETFIAHGGDNPGFKNLVVYSVTRKRGLVFLSNSDRGKLLGAKLCEMALGLDIAPYWNAMEHYREQYPSAALDLLRAFDEQGESVMFREIEKRGREKSLNAATLQIVGDLFRYGGGKAETTRQLYEENTRLYPDSALSYYSLGELLLGRNDYQGAYRAFTKARELKPGAWNFERPLKECQAGLREMERRKVFLVKLREREETTVQAEDYNLMAGVGVGTTIDTGGGLVVGHTDTDDWMDYRIEVPAAGTYGVLLRVASLSGSQLELRLGETVLTTVDIPPTNGWENWTSVAGKVTLPAGSQILRVHINRGFFNLNWLKLSPPAAGVRN